MGLEQDAGIDINKIIEEAYSKYGDLIDINVITPDLIRVLFLIRRSNDLGFRDTELTNIQNYIQEQGHEAVGAFGEPHARIIYGIIHLGRLAKENGYTSEQYNDLVYDYYYTGAYGDPLNAVEMFQKYFYPAYSKDAPAELSEPQPNSPYAKAKAAIDQTISEKGNNFNIDINNVIENAYAKYGDLIDKDIVNPDFVKTLVALTIEENSNLTAMNPNAVSQVNELLKESGIDVQLNAQHNSAQSIEALMIYATVIARQRHLGADKVDEIAYNYNLEISLGNVENSAFWTGLFRNSYYPWLSKYYREPLD